MKRFPWMLTVATAALGLLVPSVGIILESGISPLLALLMLGSGCIDFCCAA